MRDAWAWALRQACVCDSMDRAQGPGQSLFTCETSTPFAAAGVGTGNRKLGWLGAVVWTKNPFPGMESPRSSGDVLTFPSNPDCVRRHLTGPLPALEASLIGVWTVESTCRPCVAGRAGQPVGGQSR